MDLRDLVGIVLRDIDEEEAAKLANREKLRDEGMRLVQHDQVEGRRLELRDAITGEVLFLGPFDEGMRMWDESWADIDTVDREVPFIDTPVPGVPEGLLDKIRDWVSSNLDEARDYAEGDGTA